MNRANTSKPILSIAIPTWNRAHYLSITLAQLHQEAAGLPAAEVEILVSDNGSTDHTQKIIEDYRARGMQIRYVRNEENIGSDRNIAQCFNLSMGRYVLLLGDDDILVDGAIAWLLQKLRKKNYGVVLLRPYGYDHDFRAEYPGLGGQDNEYSDAGTFLSKIGALSTLISANVINKSLLHEVDARQFCGSNLVQLHLVIRAAIKGMNNCETDRYLVACKRNNSGGYDFSEVFVQNFCTILDQYRDAGLSENDIASIEKRMLVGFYPSYVWKQCIARHPSFLSTQGRFENRFNGRWIYKFFVAPIFWLPRPFAIVWGGVSMAAGRVLTGGVRRGYYFLLWKLRRYVAS